MGTVLVMLPVTSSGYSSRRDNFVLATATKQLKRRFGRKLRRAFRKRRLVFVGLTCLVLISWWILGALQSKAISDAVSITVAVLVSRRWRCYQPITFLLDRPS